MMLSRVATFPQTNQMLNAAMQTESVMANGQMQEETGMVSMDYGGLGGQTSKQFINLQISVERSQSYMDAANSVDNKLQAMTTATTQMSDLLTNLRTTLTAASNAGNTDYSSLQQSGQQMLQQMASLLNTKYNGQYLFGGAQTGSPPVDASSSNYPPATTPSSPDTSYYKGDDQVASVRVSDTEVVSYGVTADNPAFEQAMRAMNLVASTNPLSAAGITEALNLAQQRSRVSPRCRPAWVWRRLPWRPRVPTSPTTSRSPSRSAAILPAWMWQRSPRRCRAIRHS